MCKTPNGEKCQTTYFWKDVSVLVFSLCFCVSVCLHWFVFVVYFYFLKSVFLSFYHFGGSFHFWALLRGLVLRPFSTCASLMSFSPFACFLWLLSLLVAFCCCSFCLFVCCCYVISRGRQSAPFFCVQPFRFCFFSWAVFHPALSFTGSVLSSLQSLDPFTF